MNGSILRSFFGQLWVDIGSSFVGSASYSLSCGMRSKVAVRMSGGSRLSSVAALCLTLRWSFGYSGPCLSRGIVSVKGLKVPPSFARVP